MKTFKWIKRITTGVLIFVLLLVVGLLVKNTIALKKNQIGSFLGYSISYVPTDSMNPTILPGDTVLIKKGNIKDAKVDDIIVYYNGERYVIHRIIEISDEGLITKGDNNYVKDDIIVTSSNYYGKYVKKVNYLNLQSIVKNKNYIFPACIIVFLLILISEGIQVAKSISKNSKEKIKQIEKDKLIDEIRKELIDEINNKSNEDNNKE